MVESSGRHVSRRSVLKVVGGAAAIAGFGPLEGGSATALAGRGNPQTVFQVRDFGAIPDDDVDDTQAIRDAFAAAQDVPGAQVVFEPGTYLIEGKEPGWREAGPVSFYAPIFDLNGYENLRVLGNGAVLQARNWAVTFRISETAGIEFHDLTIDWARDLPHTEGIVVADTPEYVDVEVKDEFAVREGLHATGLLHFNLERQRIEQPVAYRPSRLQPCEPISESVLRCHKHPEISEVSFPVGQGLIVDHVGAKGAAFTTAASSDVVLRGVTIHTAPGMATQAVNVHNYSIIDTTIAPPSSGGRWKSCSRDAVWVMHVSGELVMRNVEIVRCGDDAYNFHGDYYIGLVEPDGHTVVIRHPGILAPTGNFEDGYRFAPLYAGDTVELSLLDQLLTPLAMGELAQVEKSVAGGERDMYQLTFAEQLPDEVLSAGEVAVFNISRMPDHAEITDSRIVNNRGGGRVMADHVVIRNNEFVETIGPAIMMVAGAPVQDRKGTPANDVTITDNVFEEVNLGGRELPDANVSRGVCITTNPAYFPDSPAGTFKNIRIRDNRFVNASKPSSLPAILLRSASDVVIDGNDFSEFVADEPVLLDGGNNDCSTIIIDGEPACG